MLVIIVADKPLLVLKGLEQIRIERTLCDVVEHIDFLIHVALSDDTTVALGHVAGFPADIQMMHCYKTLLDIGSCAHFCGAAQQDAHIAGAHFREQCGFFASVSALWMNSISLSGTPAAISFLQISS